MTAASEQRDDGAPAQIGLSTALDRRHAWAQLFGDAPGPEPVHVAQFRIVRRLGAGGMGVVYEAIDERLGRKVAVKLLRGGTTAADANAARLLREARAMALVTHPNVVTIHEVGEYAGRTFIAMELVAGRTLRAWASERPRELEDVLAVFEQAARGLAAAHAAGLVHRDFKPENVLVGEDGRVRVLDFGLARTREHDDDWLDAQGAGAGDPDALDTRLTASGAIAGTPAYMAPEQWQGHAADHRADQFAWAIALWEATMGQRPYAGTTVAELAHAVMGGALPSPPASARVPPWLLAILRRALANDPGLRFATMDELLVALADRGRAARAPRRRRIAVAAATTGAAAIATAVYLATPTVTPDPCPSGMSRIPGNDVLAPYCLDRTEVTVAAWQACVDAGGCDPGPRSAYNDLKKGAEQVALLAEISEGCTRAEQRDHPVNCVSHEQAERMCAWRGARLPTDDEWQWAAHGADKEWPYPWGTTPPDQTICISVDWRNPRLSTCAVDASRLNDRSPQSLVDLIGNVWEWTSTRSGPDEMNARIYRGGGFRNQYTGPWPEAADGSPRSFWGEHTFKDPEVGFRCASTLVED